MIASPHSVFAEKSIFSDWIGSFAKLGVAEVLLDQEFENTEIKNYQQELNYISAKNKVIQEEIQYLRAENEEYRALIKLLQSDEKTTNEIKNYQQELNYISAKNKVIQEIQYLRAENEEYQALIKLLNSDEKTTNEISSVIYDDIYTAKNKNNPSSFSSSLSYEFADVRMEAGSWIQKTDNPKLDKYFLYVESIPASATNIENTVLSAVKFWESRVDVKFEIVDSINGANLILKFVQELPDPYGGFVFNGKLVKIGLGNSNCDGNWHPFDEQTITLLITHELGHVMGFKHSQDQNTIMYSSIYYAKYSQIKESYTLNPGESLFIQGCTLRPDTSYHYEIFTDDSGKKIDYFFIPSKIEYQNFLNGKQFKYYSDPDCLDLNRSGQIGICKNVSDNAGLLLIAPRTENESQFSVKVLLQEIL
ncbi:MAG: matrixin family metalloprotease [Thaumarchaeota archaeon]|nr:matrixin family metalloprotease [Nitrososphaerota archaeon]